MAPREGSPRRHEVLPEMRFTVLEQTEAKTRHSASHTESGETRMRKGKEGTKGKTMRLPNVKDKFSAELDMLFIGETPYLRLSKTDLIYKHQDEIRIRRKKHQKKEGK